MQKLTGSILATILSLIYQVGHANPWFTGPLLALAAQTVPPGHTNAFFEVNNAISNSIYNSKWERVSEKTFSSTQMSPQLSYGLNDRFDIQYNALYVINQNQGVSYEHMGDASVILGFQALSQEKNHSQPDLRITLQEVLPSGIYNRFTAARNGADATGMGSYQTSLGFNFQYLSQLNEKHYLNSHVTVAFTYVSSVAINGISTFGGTPQTEGIINQGNAVSIDWAGELTLTQKWVAVMEANIIYQQASTFHGVVGDLGASNALDLLQPTKQNIGQSNIGRGNLDQISLAPALEYNFSANYGAIVGVWFTVAGKNTPEFIAPIIQFTASW